MKPGRLRPQRLNPDRRNRMPGEAVLRYERLETRPGTAAGAESAFSPEAARVEPFEGTRGHAARGAEGGVRRFRVRHGRGREEAAGIFRAGRRRPEGRASGTTFRRSPGCWSASRRESLRVELYRLQYLSAGFRVQASSGSKVSQQAGQGIESLLKQQG